MRLAAISILSVTALTLLPIRGLAQYRPACYPYYTGRTYQQPQPYYPPPEPYYPAQKVIANEVGVAPFIVTVPVESMAVPIQAYGVPYYYSATQAYAEKAYLREVLREEFRNLLSGSSTLTQQRSQSTTQTVTQPAAVGQQAVVQQSTTQGQAQSRVQEALTQQPDDVTPIDLQQKVMAAYNGRANCLSCHPADGPARGPRIGQTEIPFRLVAKAGDRTMLNKLNSDKRWKIYAMSAVGAMPPTAANDATKAMESAHLQYMLQYAAIKDQ